jgi:hypothetical protein
MKYNSLQPIRAGIIDNTNVTQSKTLQDVIDMIDNQFDADKQLKTSYKGLVRCKYQLLLKEGLTEELATIGSLEYILETMKESLLNRRNYDLTNPE